MNKKTNKIRETNLYYTIHKGYFEINLKELSFKNKIKFTVALLRNKTIKIYGENKELLK